MKTNKISNVQFIEKYNDGLSHSELAAHFGVSPTTVQKYVKRLKLPKRELIDKIDKVRFAELWNQGYSCSMIGREFGLCGTTIIRIARKMGLKERTLKRATTKAYTVVSEPKPTFILPKLAKSEPAEEKPTKFIIPPTLKQIEKQNQQAEIAKAEREYKIYKR
jgi:hypothetical protein